MNEHTGPKPPAAFLKAQKAHIARVQEHLQTAVKHGFNPHPTQYKRVIAILTHFQDDDIGCGQLEDDLAQTFKAFYNFTVEKVLFDTNRDPGRQLAGVIGSLDQRQFTEEGSVIILVFSGHGQRMEIENGKETLLLGGALGPDGGIRAKTLDWSYVTSLLNNINGDVLHILDYCFAAEAVNGKAEVLAATSATETAAADIDTCFTRALIEELKRASSQTTTVATLHGELIRCRYALKLEFTPFYSEREKKPSIVLMRLGYSGPYKAPKITPNGPRVLVTAHVKEDLSSKDVNELKTWLLSNVPIGVAGMDVRLEGFFESDLSILLLSLPFETWSQLPQDGAYNYVGIVESGNKLLEWNGQNTTIAWS